MTVISVKPINNFMEIIGLSSCCILTLKLLHTSSTNIECKNLDRVYLHDEIKLLAGFDVDITEYFILPPPPPPTPPTHSANHTHP